MLTDRFTLLADALNQDTQRLQARAVARNVETALRALDEGDPDGASQIMDQTRVLADLAGL